MSDVKAVRPKTIDEIRKAFLKMHHVALGQERSYMSIPADPNRDADLIVSAAIGELKTLREAAADLREALRSTLEALEAGFPGDESVGLPEFPSMSMNEAWARRVAARAVLAKYGTTPAPPVAHETATGGEAVLG
jgi:hypothetical protein